MKRGLKRIRKKAGMPLKSVEESAPMKRGLKHDLKVVGVLLPSELKRVPR